MKTKFIKKLPSPLCPRPPSTLHCPTLFRRPHAASADPHPPPAAPIPPKKSAHSSHPPPIPAHISREETGCRGPLLPPCPHPSRPTSLTLPTPPTPAIPPTLHPASRPTSPPSCPSHPHQYRGDRV